MNNDVTLSKMEIEAVQNASHTIVNVHVGRRATMSECAQVCNLVEQKLNERGMNVRAAGGTVTESSIKVDVYKR